MVAVHVPPVDDSDLELLGALNPGGSASHHCRATAKLAVAGAALLCLAGAALALTPTRASLPEVAPRGAIGLVGTLCRDTPGWTNGHRQCNTNGYKGPGCEPEGLSCEAYSANGWCAAGVPTRAWAVRDSMNQPELHCCVCGGGSQLDNGAAPPPLPPAPAVVPAVRVPLPVVPAAEYPSPVVAEAAKPKKVNTTSPSACSAYTACATAGLAGDCCPNMDGVRLECCNSALVCVDTPEWTNGYVSCSRHGLTEADGCTPKGVTCQGYLNQSFCAGGHVLSGKEWAMGPRFNNPELNCCACGKPSGTTE